MQEVIIPADKLGILIARCTHAQLNPKSIVTIQNDGKHFKLLTQNPGEERILAASIPHPVQPPAISPGEG